MRRFTIPFLLPILLFSLPIGAQNLVPFSSFDTSADLANGWGNLGPGKVWSSVDVDDSPSSGSLLIINDLPAGTGALVSSSCIPVVEGGAYEYSAWYFMQFLQPGSGYAQVQLQWLDLCGGTFVGGDLLDTAVVEGEWTEITGPVVVPPGVTGVRILLVNGKTAGNQGEDRDVYFDEIFLPEPDAATAGLAAVILLTRLRSRAGGRRRRSGE